jgi:AcrR family transcriptional regulator
VKHPSVYHYFGNRDGLVVAAQAERYRRSIQFSNAELADRLNAAATRSEYIAALDMVLRSFADDAGIARRRVRREVLGSAVFRPDLARRVTEMIDRQVEDLIEIFSHGRGAQWVTSPYELRTVMLWWLGTIQGRQFIDERGEPELSKEWDDLVARAVVRALFGANASPNPGDR